MGVDAFEEVVEVVAVELPFERGAGGLPVVLEVQQSGLDGVEVVEVVGVRTLRWMIKKQISSGGARGRDACTDWLYDWWERIDTWIEAPREPGTPTADPD